jgi:2-phospho-L-lactate guanylyltransferase
VKTVAVVPVKGLGEAKSRLAGVLSPGERAKLTLEMLAHVLETVGRSGVIDKIGVISPEVEQLSLPDGVARIKQIEPGLNNLLEQGREWALSEGADRLMVIFADLPLLSESDLVEISELGREGGTLVLAPDRHGHGTNVMLSHPVTLARFAFGTGSYHKHRRRALEDGARVETYRSLGTSLDLDTPDDMAYMEREMLVASGCGADEETA